MRQSGRRMLVVERQVRTAGLDRAEQPDDRMRGALHAEGDGVVATHSEGTEATRKSVRPDVQLLISKHAVRGDHRVERRRLRGDALEQLCDGLAACERRSTVE